MPEFHFHHPVEVRYGDLDPQGHVNSAKYVTYLEQARISYLRHLGLWKSASFLDIGIIIADTHIQYLRPVLFGQPIAVAVRVSRLGNKSMTMEYQVLDVESRREMASGSTVLVAYDYRTQQTIPIPESWRQAITDFETL